MPKKPHRRKGLHKPRQGATLKGAFAELLGQFVSVKAAAEFLPLSASQLFRCSDDCETDQPRADVVLTLEGVCGEPVVTTHMARVQGYELMPVLAEQAEPAELAERLAATAEDYGAFVAEMARALADDGDVDQAEAGPALTKLERHMADCALLYQLLKARRDGEVQ